ncbi:hypothetical protein F2Q70_00024350 [Brassica cretica]|uniref:Uncharacterized protein n=1 Tax=Brassica cretica TaxID=69181 RepID=A0A8S9L112_BRACR|nr:hypothetical protein F2Q70_00024350 [Brassica cretica]
MKSGHDTEWLLPVILRATATEGTLTLVEVFICGLVLFSLHKVLSFLWGSEMALINLEAHVLLLSGGFVVLMLQSKLLFIQPDWNLTMTSTTRSTTISFLLQSSSLLQYLKSDGKPQRRALSLSSMVSQEVFVVISASLRASGGP